MHSKEEKEEIIRPNLSKISGFPNYSEAEHYLFTTWIDRLSALFLRNGFSKILFPPIEYIDNLKLKGGISKQIYQVGRLQNQTLTDLGLPFDRTVPLALFIARHENEMVFPYKRQDISWSFRGENPQAGRFRGFIQADIDIIDTKRDIMDDSCCLATIIEGLDSLGIPPFTLCVNHLDISRSLLRAKGVEKENFPSVMRYIDKLEKLTKDEAIKEGMEALGSLFDEEFLQIFSYKGTIKDFPFVHLLDEEGNAGLEELQKVMNYVHELGAVNCELYFAPNMVRGLDYYTGVIFETFMKGMEQFGSIASGGRYDHLVSSFSDSKHCASIGGVGGSIGLTRLFDILSREKKVVLNRASSVDVYIIPRVPELLSSSMQLLKALRKGGYSADIINKKNVTKGLDYCNRKGVPFAVMVMNENEFVVKDLEHKRQLIAEDIEKASKIVIDFLSNSPST